ncbi:MAG: ABC transporter permease [Tenacibaculum sp.]|nr:ABC transporter permease [Tenacibaculum sp.]
MKNGFLKVFITECKCLIKSPRRIFYTLVFPLLLFGFLSAIFYKGVARDLPVAYLDLNQTQISSKLVSMLDATPSIRLSKIVKSQEEAKRLIKEQEVYGFIVIPEDFSKKIVKGLSPTVVCYTNNQFLLPVGLIQKDFLQTVGTFSAGVKIKKETQNNVQLQKVLADVQPILTDVHVLYNPYVNYAFYLLVIFLPAMLQMIIIMVTIYVLGTEFKYNTTESWYNLSNNNAFSALFGKILPYTIILFFIGWWMNYFLFKLVGVPLKIGLFNVTLITFLLIIVYQLMGVVIASISKDFRGALTVGSGFTAVALSFAAYTFPVEGLPTSMQYFAKIYPFTHFTEYYVNRAIKGIAIQFTWEPIVSILIFVIIFVLAFPKFVKRLKNNGYA